LEVLSVALRICFYAVFLVAVWRFVRRPGRVELALLLVFGATAMVFAAQELNSLLPDLGGTFTNLSIVLLLSQPVFIIWLVHLIRPQPRWVLGLVVAAFAISVAGFFLPAERLDAAILFIGGYFASAEGAAALILLRIGQRRHGLPRLRLRVAAFATLLFAGAIVIASVGAVSTAPEAPNPAQPLANLAALAAALAYIVAFLPPFWLHGIAQRAVAFDLGTQLVSAPSGTQPGVLWGSLAEAALRLLGAEHVAIVDASGNGLARAPAVGPRPAGADLADGPITTIDVALSGRLAAGPHLIAHIEGRVLFIEDDTAVLRLLGTMTLHAVEREGALVRLAEVARELEAAAVVRSSEARFRALLEAVPSAVLAVDASGSIVWATGPTAELFGMPVPELAGRRVSELIADHDIELAPSPGEEGRVRRAELTARRQDGSTLPVDVAATEFELDDRPFQLFVLSDASWRAAANQLRDRFLGVLSHELRTPITSIYGGTHLLINRGERLDDESRREVLTNVASESERLLRITENLVVLARVERGADFFDFRPVALRPVLADFVAHEQQLWPGMTIELDVTPHLPLVAADEDYLAQVLRNLLSNAGKYAGPSANVRISASEQDGAVVVRVIDDGPGLKAAESDQLFDLYYRAADAATAPGAGIGLFVCRSLVEAMGGEVWARNHEGAGAEFGFSLPQYVEPGEYVASSMTADAPAGSSGA
jgi:PAS domain S-box-containing protein